VKQIDKNTPFLILNWNKVINKQNLSATSFSIATKVAIFFPMPYVKDFFIFLKSRLAMRP